MIEKLELGFKWKDTEEVALAYKINELIDEVNKLRDEFSDHDNDYSRHL